MFFEEVLFKSCYNLRARRYVIGSTTNAEHISLLKGKAAKLQESADPSSPKKTGARKKEVVVKIQGGATIKLCSSCMTSNKIEEKVQPKRRRSVAKDEGW